MLSKQEQGTIKVNKKMKMVAFHGSAWILEHWVINFSSFIVLHLLLLQIILIELSDHLLFVSGVGRSVL